MSILLFLPFCGLVPLGLIHVCDLSTRIAALGFGSSFLEPIYCLRCLIAQPVDLHLWDPEVGRWNICPEEIQENKPVTWYCEPALFLDINRVGGVGLGSLPANLSRHQSIMNYDGVASTSTTVDVAVDSSDRSGLTISRFPR